MPFPAHAVLPLVRSVRPLLEPFHGKVESLGNKGAHVHDVVTRLDREIEQYLEGGLRKLMPGVPFVGEEFGGNRGADAFWLADPIDGTSCFMRGEDGCTTMLAYIEGGVVMFSAIYDFLRDRMYYAERGRGAYCDGRLIRVTAKPRHEWIIGLETKLAGLDILDVHKLLKDSFRDSSIVMGTCAGSDLVKVATGAWAGRIVFNGYGKDYDFAPGSLLVEEAGGIVTNIDSTGYRYDDCNFIAATPSLYRSLTKEFGAVFPVSM